LERKGGAVDDIFKRWRVERVINATGTVTRLGASRMDAAVIDAMAEAAEWSVDIAELQGNASDLIASVTGAEAGIVTAGASAALLLGAAACMAGFDPAKMGRLPDTAGMRDEFIVSRSHRNSYDHAVRAAGGRSGSSGPYHWRRRPRYRRLGIRCRDQRAHRRYSLPRARRFAAASRACGERRPCPQHSRAGGCGGGGAAGA
jgi:hypothetical protein